MQQEVKKMAARLKTTTKNRIVGPMRSDLNGLDYLDSLARSWGMINDATVINIIRQDRPESGEQGMVRADA